MGAIVREPAKVSLYVVGEETPPRYDTTPEPGSRWMDDVNECVATLGMAAFGLYNYLEKVVDENATKRISVSELAAIFQQSERYIQEALTKLINGGWVVRVEQTNRFGMQMANVWRLPFHENTRTYGGEPTGEPRGEPQTPSEFTPLYTLTTDGTEKRENEKKEIKKGVQGGTKKRTPYTPEFEAFWKEYPTGYGVKSLAFAEWVKLSEDDRSAAMAAVVLWRASEKWQGGYVRGCERWLKYREFEQAPPPRKKSSNPNAGGQRRWVEG